MSMSNRFETESFARELHQQIESSLRRSAQLAEAFPEDRLPERKSNLEAGMIMTGAAVASLLLAMGLTSAMAFAFAALP